MNQNSLSADKDIELSVIIPYSSAPQYGQPKEIYMAYKKMLDSVGLSYEVIVVIDGDLNNFKAGIKEIYGLKKAGADFKIIKLAKWFGEGTALSIGFEHSRGKKILTLPPYRQVEINEIPGLISALRDDDMVVGNRLPRLDRLLKRLQTKIFHKLVCFRGDFEFHDLGCSVRCFNRRILEKVYLYGEQHRFFPILVHRFGYRILEFNLTQSKEDALQKRYPPLSYLRRFVDLVAVFFLVKFTKKPLRFFGMSGFLILILGTILAIYLFIERVFFFVALSNRPLMLLDLLLFVLGIQFFAIGLIGEIIIYTHAKQLKDYTISKIIN